MTSFVREARRPAPDALLEQVTPEGRGRLKIFLGAAPGVGKTYEMLTSGEQKKKEGIDVVTGIVETHGRIETERLTHAIETVPRAQVVYKGRILDELDIDAVLKRRPALVLVDELAHTNAPGSRHPKRFQDVEEILAAGIDVYTTLNVQHIESLNDVVAQITRIRVRETVPDSIIDRADEIEVVDITPEELVQRLHDGKVYVRDAAQRALKHYFSPGNLTALRELALRRTAQRVDEQLLSYMRAHAITGPWPTDERLLVCIDGSENASGLVRYARRSADRLRTSWAVLYVEKINSNPPTDAERDHIVEALRLATSLGGEVVRLNAESIAGAILDYARSENVTQIVVGQPKPMRLLGSRHSTVGELIKNADGVGIHVIPRSGKMAKPEVRTRRQDDARNPYPYFISSVAVAAALGIGEMVLSFVPLPNISLIFLAAILYSSVNFGLWPSLYASLISTLAYNFFFLPPLYTFTISDPANVLALIFFTIVSILTSNLTARTRRQVLVAQSQLKTTAGLNAFSRKLAGISDLDDLLWAAAFQISSMLKVRVVFLFPDEIHMTVSAAYPPDDVADEADLAAARWAFDHQRAAGRASDTLPGARRLFLPLKTTAGAFAVVGLDREAPGPLFTIEERQLLDALLDQIAVSIERIRLAEDVDNARVLSETERLRSTLLTSISHDLRTPLASIIGAATSLKSYFEHFSTDQRNDLISTIEDEAERLNRFVGNLLDITKLESGALNIQMSEVDIAEIIETVLRRASNLLSKHKIKASIPPALPSVMADPILLEQVFFNLLDNASKYSSPNGTISIDTFVSGGGVVVNILDDGEGIPADDLESIFDKFQRVGSGDNRPAGTGLGLAVCRGFVEAFNGTISAANRGETRGARFTVTIPTAHVSQLTKKETTA